MRPFASMKYFSKEDLYCLLNACSESLEYAYQVTNEGELWSLAMQAQLACEALGFEIRSKENYLTH
jgi:hypothetical protein